VLLATEATWMDQFQRHNSPLSIFSLFYIARLRQIIRWNAGPLILSHYLVQYYMDMKTVYWGDVCRLGSCWMQIFCSFV